jgi:serine/threonine protein kinase
MVANRVVPHECLVFHFIKPYSEADAARLLREVASALDFLHGIGIVHGDLKPENLMLSTEKASDAVVKVRNETKTKRCLFLSIKFCDA